jgi:hypothetical protein
MKVFFIEFKIILYAFDAIYCLIYIVVDSEVTLLYSLGH